MFTLLFVLFAATDHNKLHSLACLPPFRILYDIFTRFLCWVFLACFFFGFVYVWLVLRWQKVHVFLCLSFYAHAFILVSCCLLLYLHYQTIVMCLFYPFFSLPFFKSSSNISPLQTVSEWVCTIMYLCWLVFGCCFHPCVFFSATSCAVWCLFIFRLVFVYILCLV